MSKVETWAINRLPKQDKETDPDALSKQAHKASKIAHKVDAPELHRKAKKAHEDAASAHGKDTPRGKAHIEKSNEHC